MVDWIRLAFGLIREAAGTEKGQEVIDDLRQRVRGKAPTVEGQAVAMATVQDVLLELQELRERTEKTLDLLVRTINAQQQALEVLEKRQRRWNLTLATGVAVALAMAVYSVAAR